MLYGKLLEVLSAKLTDESEWLGTVIHNKIGINWTLSFYNTHTLTFACYYYNYCCHCRSISVTFFLPQQATKGLAVNGSGQMLVLLRYYIQHMTHIQKQTVLCYAYRNMAKTASKMWEKSPSSPRATRRAVHKRFPAQSFNLTENKKKKKKKKTEINLGRTVCPSQLS